MSSNDIKLVRLSTGEEVVGRIKETEDTVAITDGILLVPAGEGKMGMIPFVPYGDGGDVVVNRNHVMFITNPGDQLKAQIVKMTSGIEIPTEGLSIIQ